jgi:hypothetical protein
MGFSQNNSQGSYKPVHYFSIKNEMVEGSKTQIIGKFFAKTVKDSETGKYSSIYMKNENGHPTPFIGKLSKIEPDYDYKITEKLVVDDSIFEKIFNDLNYSGFACPDFIIYNEKITIFEINPRPGGSLVANITYLNLFLDTLNEK